MLRDLAWLLNTVTHRFNVGHTGGLCGLWVGLNYGAAAVRFARFRYRLVLCSDSLRFHSALEPRIAPRSLKLSCEALRASIPRTINCPLKYGAKLLAEPYPIDLLLSHVDLETNQILLEHTGGALIMDPRLLEYYNQELSYLRESGQEFSERFPKIASRLGLHESDITDPYVERLLEGFSS